MKQRLKLTVLIRVAIAFPLLAIALPLRAISFLKLELPKTELAEVD